MSRIIVVILLACFVSPSAASWVVQAVDTGGDGQLAPAIALDSSGYPHITHVGASKVYHSWNDGAAWQTEQIWGGGSNGPECPDIVLDNTDIGHASFAHGGGLYYSVENSYSNGWTTEWVGIGYTLWTSIALNASDYPAIACYAYPGLFFVEWNGSDWTEEQVSFTDDQGDCCSLVMDPGGTPRIAYCAYSPSPAVKYAYRDEYGQWHSTVVDDAMSSAPRGTSLAVDDTGNPHISYNTSSEIRYASWNGASWDIATLDAIDTGLWELDTSLALDQYGFPHIAHCGGSGDSLMYSVNQGGGWITESICPIGGGDPDLVLDGSGRPHIAFVEGVSMGLAYAYNNEPSEIGSTLVAQELLSFRIGPNPFSGTLSITCSSPPQVDSRIRILDVTGRLITEIEMEGSGSTCWQPETWLPDGTYLVVLTSGAVEVVQRCVLLR